MIKRKGPEYAREEADRMHDEGRLSKEAYDIKSRLARMHEVGEDYERNQEAEKSKKGRKFR